MAEGREEAVAMVIGYGMQRWPMVASSLKKKKYWNQRNKNNQQKNGKMAMREREKLGNGEEEKILHLIKMESL